MKTRNKAHKQCLWLREIFNHHFGVISVTDGCCALFATHQNKGTGVTVERYRVELRCRQIGFYINRNRCQRHTPSGWRQSGLANFSKGISRPCNAPDLC